jgi:hypothetical protein
MSEVKTTSRIQVTFGVDVPVKEIEELKKLLEDQRPGTAEYSATWDRLKVYHTYFLGRLEGECAAYMNIAKEQARQLFGV